MTLAGTLPNPRQVSGPGPVDINYTIPGLTTRIRGTLDAGKPVPVADVMVDTQAASLGDVLDALELNRVLEGSGSVRTRLAGPIDGLAASELAAEADFASGDKIRLNGSIANVNDGAGIDVTVQADLAAFSRHADQTASVIDIDLTGFHGRLRGDSETLHLIDARIFTNIGSAELKNIGPITVDRITKDEKGRLGFIGIHVLAGSETNPSLDASGAIADVLQIQGVTMDGIVNAKAADLLGFLGPDTDKLGRLKGRFAISDTDGTGTGLTRRVAGKPLLARFQKLLRPAVIKAPGNAFLAAQRSNAVLATLEQSGSSLQQSGASASCAECP
jgi:hypothetical protein